MVETRCPQCGSGNIMKDYATTVGLNQQAYFCLNCRHKWIAILW
jgi:transposase-like protein